MDEKKIYCKIQFRNVYGGPGHFHTYSEAYNKGMNVEEYRLTCENRALEENDAAFVKAVSVQITTHDKKGNYILDKKGNLVLETIYSAVDPR